MKITLFGRYFSERDVANPYGDLRTLDGALFLCNAGVNKLHPQPLELGATYKLTVSTQPIKGGKCFYIHRGIYYTDYSETKTGPSAVLYDAVSSALNKFAGVGKSKRVYAKLEKVS